MAAISPAMPPVFVSSWTTRQRLVLRTDCKMVSSSSGCRVRRSMTSASIPSFAKAGGVERGVHHGRIRDDGQVLSLAAHDSFAQRHGVIALWKLFLDAAVKKFVLEEQHRVVVANGGFKQPFGVVGRGGIHDL